MKIYCDYCGAQIDTDKHRTCPNCGGSYASDDELLSEKKRQNELGDMKVKQKRLELDRMEIENENLRRNSRVSLAGKGCLVPVIVILSLLGVLFLGILIYVIAEDENDKKTAETSASSISISYSMDLKPIDFPDIPDVNDIEIPDQFTTTDPNAPVPTPGTSAAWPDKVTGDGFAVSCVSAEQIDPYPFSTAEGNIYVSFRLVVENTGTEKIKPERTISCLADGFVCPLRIDSSRNKFPSDKIPPGAKAEGYYCFEIPMSADKISLIYGENISFIFGIRDIQMLETTEQ